ncbi:MAG: protein-glutamate methylesterase/protein-glutamine glutaminase [Candidatus Muiribacteriota bacterium]
MIKVLIVDDSAVVRKILTKELKTYSDIKVVGSARDPFIARDMIIDLQPDVLTLDIEMPKMDGLTFLSKLMKYYPVPTVIVSSLTRNNTDMTIKAMEIGAVDVISKPGSSFTVGELVNSLIAKIRVAARADLSTFTRKNKRNTVNSKIKIDTTSKFVAIGASTGGTEAIKEVVENLPHNFPGIVIAQHMPAGFTHSFAQRLNEICAMEVKEAEGGEQVAMGKILIAPGNYHMVIKRKGARYYTRLNQNPPVHFQRPSCDVLFNSVASEAGKNAVGVILTGMGSDGAEGIKNLKDNNAWTIGQNERTCVVYGMPNAARKIGGISQELALNEIPQRLIDIFNSQEYTF